MRVSVEMAGVTSAMLEELERNARAVDAALNKLSGVTRTLSPPGSSAPGSRCVTADQLSTGWTYFRAIPPRDPNVRVQRIGVAAGFVEGL